MVGCAIILRLYAAPGTVDQRSVALTPRRPKIGGIREPPSKLLTVNAATEDGSANPREFNAPAHAARPRLRFGSSARQHKEKQRIFIQCYLKSHAIQASSTKFKPDIYGISNLSCNPARSNLIEERAMSSMMIESGSPSVRLAATARRYRLAAALALGAVFLAIGLASPNSGSSSAFIDLAVPQIVTTSGP
jgi:hypothetical protein